MFHVYGNLELALEDDSEMLKSHKRRRSYSNTAEAGSESEPSTSKKAINRKIYSTIACR